MTDPISQPEELHPTAGVCEPDYHAVMQRSRTLAEFMRKVQTPRVEAALSRFSARCKIDAANLEMLRRELLRLYSPWPTWVLRTVTECWAVEHPRVRKTTILEFLRAIHWLFFEAAIHGPPTPMPEFAFPSDTARDLLSAFGHAEAHYKAMVTECSKLEQKCRSDDMRSEIEQIRADLHEHYAHFANTVLHLLARQQPEERTLAMETVVDAKRATFDDEDNIRETSATPAYRRILENWVEIEVMSGPTELCRFLDPVLGVGDYDSKLDKVKKLCRRLEIEFQPPVSRDKVGG